LKLRGDPRQRIPGFLRAHARALRVGVWGVLAVSAAVWLVVGMAARRASSSAQPSYSGDGPPKLLQSADPEYSDEARLARINASVELTARVGLDGRLRDVKVSRGAGFGLDDKAVEAASRWRFSPARRQGRLVEIKTVMVVPFRAFPGRPTAHLQFSAPAGTIPPRLEVGDPGELSAGSDVVTRTLGVSVEGRVSQIGGPDDKVKQLLSKWRFSPTLVRGAPVPALGTLTVYSTK